MIDIVMTIHNPTELAVKCLKSLIDTKNQSRLIVVDNASTDRSNIAPFVLASTNYLYLKNQVSIAESWNIGLEKCTENYVLITNDDIMFAPGWMEPLTRAISADLSIGVIQPYNTLSALPDNFPDNYIKDDKVGKIPDNNFIGCCFMIRQNIFPKLKEFDRAYFPEDADDYTYFYPKFYPFGPEDQDFYRRVRQIKYKTVTHYGSYVHHYTGETMKQIPNFEELKAKGKKILDERWSKWDTMQIL